MIYGVNSIESQDMEYIIIINFWEMEYNAFTQDI